MTEFLVWIKRDNETIGFLHLRSDSAEGAAQQAIRRGFDDVGTRLFVVPDDLVVRYTVTNDTMRVAERV